MPLPWCEHCGMHMPVSQLWRHNWMSIFYRSMEMSLKRRYLEMAERLGEMEFRFYERLGCALLEGVSQFKYLGRPLDQKYDD